MNDVICHAIYSHNFVLVTTRLEGHGRSNVTHVHRHCQRHVVHVQREVAVVVLNRCDDINNRMHTLSLFKKKLNKNSQLLYSFRKAFSV